jgi:hypothetical protein
MNGRFRFVADPEEVGQQSSDGRYPHGQLISPRSAKAERDECKKCASRDDRCCGIGSLSRLARSTAGEYLPLAR